MSRGWRQRRRGLPRLTSIRWPTIRGARGTRITERKGPSLPNPLAAPEDVGSRPDVRLWVVGAVFAALFVFMGVRLAFLQIADHTAYAESIQTNTLVTVSNPAPRGPILSREGTVLVSNTIHQELVLSRLDAEEPGLLGRVAALAGIAPSQVTAALMNPRYNQYQPVPILTDTPVKVIDYLEEHRPLFPGVSVQTLTQRTYPPPAGGALAPQLLGYVGDISTQQLAELGSKGAYSASSVIGQAGIEQYYDSYLRGHDGTEKIEVDASGDPIKTVENELPVVGDTVVLNLDAGLQNYVTSALAADIYRVRNTYDHKFHGYPPAPNGAVVVLDPNNGHVLAMVSFPSYNLDVWKGGISQAHLNTLFASGAIYNNAIQGLYIPGSTFKLISATAALQDGLVNPSDYIYDSGKFTVPGCPAKNHGCVFYDDEVTGLGEVNLPLAITESSDYYFYRVGALFWEKYENVPGYRYGSTPIQDVAADYGLAAPTGVDLPDEASSIVDSRKVRLAEHAQYPKDYPYPQWYTGDNVEMAFGQGGTVLTPLGLANAYATFANGGTRYTPQVAAAVLSPGGHLAQLYGKKIAGHVSLPPSVRNPILQGLLGVVNDPRGTAYATFREYANFDMSTFPIAGKTGTASVSKDLEPNSWFVGFGPAAHPKYVVLCVVAQGGYGADAAAPVVAQTFNYLVKHPVGALHLPLQHTSTTTTTPTHRTP